MINRKQFLESLEEICAAQGVKSIALCARGEELEEPLMLRFWPKADDWMAKRNMASELYFDMQCLGRSLIHDMGFPRPEADPGTVMPVANKPPTVGDVTVGDVDEEQARQDGAVSSAWPTESESERMVSEDPFNVP